MNVQRYVKGEKRVFRIKDILDEKRKREVKWMRRIRD